jgi:hypothetical protein
MRIAGALKIATIVLGVGIYAAATLYLMPTVFTEIWGHSAEEGEVHGGGRMLSHANHPHMRAHAHGPAGQAQHRHPHSARYGQEGHGQQPQRPQDVRHRAAVALADLRARVKTRLADAWQHAMERKLSIDAAGAGDRGSVPLASALMSDGGSLQDAVALHQVQPAHAPPAAPAAAAAPPGSGVGATSGSKERAGGGIAQPQPAVYGRRWGVQAAGGG